jgi:hypothetical protein
MKGPNSFLLIAWVGFACPVLCGIRAEASSRAPTKTSCCKHTPSESREPNGPAAPQEDAPDRCFCSAHVVLVHKSESFQEASVFVHTLECHAAAFLQSGVSPRLPSIPQYPPETYRVLPLLI